MYNIMASKKPKHIFDTDYMRILPVKPKLPKLPLPRELNPILPKPPITILFLATCGQGKTSLVSNPCWRKEMYG